MFTGLLSPSMLNDHIPPPPPILGPTCLAPGRPDLFDSSTPVTLAYRLKPLRPTPPRESTHPTRSGLLTKIQDRIDTQQNDSGFAYPHGGMPHGCTGAGLGRRHAMSRSAPSAPICHVPEVIRPTAKATAPRAR